jgi:hypothetical protein
VTTPTTAAASASTPKTGTDTSPVTVVLSRRPKPGYEAQLGDWLRGVLAVASTFRGFLDVEVVTPDQPDTNEFVVVFRWATKRDFERWHASVERARWLRQVEGMSDEPVVQTISGLESWFARDGGPVSPPRWKMALVTFGVIWVLATALAFAAGPLLDRLALPARTAFTTAVLVPLLTWVVMPRVTKAMSGWLYRR